MPSLAITWAQRLKRVFNIDVETCRVRGSAARVAVPAHPCAHGIRASMHIIACIEDPVVIRKILNHLQEKSLIDTRVQIANPRASPQASLFY